MKHSYFSRRLLSVFMAFALGLSVLLAKDFVVVIDAGHGGHDPGSLGSKAKEKSLICMVSRRLTVLSLIIMLGMIMMCRAVSIKAICLFLFIPILWIKSPPIVGKLPVLLLGHWGYTEARRTWKSQNGKIPLYIWRMTFRLVMKDSIRIRPSRILFLNSCSINTWSRV